VTARPAIILASASRHRGKILADAGIAHNAEAARIDEREVEAPLLDAGCHPARIARELAIAKARDVSARHPGAAVIGADQTLEFQKKLLHKPTGMAEARERLASFRAATHTLNSAVAIVRDGEIRWSHVERCDVRFRDFSDSFLDNHVRLAGDGILGSVGAYQIEGLGAQLVDTVDGDLFSVIGLPLFPLLEAMRRLGLIET
jgi:septum formation protein